MQECARRDIMGDPTIKLLYQGDWVCVIEMNMLFLFYKNFFMDKATSEQKPKTTGKSVVGSLWVFSGCRDVFCYAYLALQGKTGRCCSGCFQSDLIILTALKGSESGRLLPDRSRCYAWYMAKLISASSD